MTDLTARPLYLFRVDLPCRDCGKYLDFLTQGHVPIADADPNRMAGTPERAPHGMRVVVLDEQGAPHEVTV